MVHLYLNIGGTSVHRSHLSIYDRSILFSHLPLQHNQINFTVGHRTSCINFDLAVGHRHKVIEKVKTEKVSRYPKRKVCYPKVVLNGHTQRRI